MPFVPLSTDGTQRASTETLRAPRVQVALEPHEAGVTVLAIEPTGLRAIGQLDLAVADAYRQVLAPLAVDGVYGICIAESSDAGTVLCLAPAESCLPAGNWPWRPLDTVEAGTPELAAWLAAGDSPAPAGEAPGELTGALAAAAAPAPRPAHRTPRKARPEVGRRATPWVLAGLIGLLMVGAVSQALTGGSVSTASPLAAADTASVAVPAWSPDPTDATLPPVVEASPAAVAEPVSGRPAAPRSVVPPAPAPPQPDPKHEESEHHSDDADSHDSDDSHKSDDSSKTDESSKPSSADTGSSKGSASTPKGAATSSKNKLPTFADLLKELAGQHSGPGGRSPFTPPKPGR